jgi:p38 MAP kinase
MLELDSEERITAELALAHPYLSQYADPTDEPSSPPYDQSFEDMEAPLETWRSNSVQMKIACIPQLSVSNMHSSNIS